jgi:multisubunit Na+/H+ antiporter MnhG subunit
MNKEQILGILRHVLTFLGGLGIAKGWIDENTVLEVVGAVSTLVGVIWSFVNKNKNSNNIPQP